MDIASLIGLVGGLFIILFGIISSASISAIVDSFWDLPSFIITIGGSIIGMIGSYTMSDFIMCFKNFGVILKNQKIDYGGLIKQIIDLSNVARKEGLLALEEVAGTLEDQFMKKGILLIVDGTEPELVRGILETELDNMDARHNKVASFYDQWGALGPAWGMIGTLIGLILMLADLQDMSKIGPSMAVALITTLYGSIIANWICVPVANKMKLMNSNEFQMKAIIIEGLLSIQAGENPRVIEEKLMSFLAPADRKGISDEGGGDAA